MKKKGIEKLTNKLKLIIHWNKVYENFADINNKKEISNIGITSCNIFSSTENIKSNSGFYSLLLILALFAIIFIIFCSKGYNLLESKIDEVIYKKFKNETKTKQNQGKTQIKSLITNEKKRNRKTNQQIKTKDKNKKKKNSNYSSKNIITDLGGNKKKSTISNNLTFLQIDKIQTKKNSKNSRAKPDTDYEFNWLTYKEAQKFDKRTECEYY